MYNSKPPAKEDLPSTSKLIKSTILALAVAGALLVTVVMPAEYGIDPTGIGKITGLKKMGAIKSSLAIDAANPAPTNTKQVATQADEKIITLAPDAWTEIKLKMDKGDKANYAWSTDGGWVNYDTHADSKPLKISYHKYTKGTNQRDEGILEAAFTGNHGWYWRNRTDKPITITLQTNGEYSDIFKMD